VPALNQFAACLIHWMMWWGVSACRCIGGKGCVQQDPYAEFDARD
jgi:hypothetical protein